MFYQAPGMMSRILGISLYNKKGRAELIKQLKDETFSRITVSFYRYVEIKNPQEFRDSLYRKLSELNVLGRIYIAYEGVNAQISIPDHNQEKTIKYIHSISSLNGVEIKNAIVDGDSFFKLTIKVKNEIVAYGIDENEYDMNIVGKHLEPDEFNRYIDNEDTVVVDIRNHYESEVGHFRGALKPDVERSQELLPEIKRLLTNQEDKKILLYCTGGIRCEKASSYLIKNNFKDVNQLSGGVINYANSIRSRKKETKFIGKNFVFDNRLGEQITDDIISACHICQSKSNEHRNCANDLCHILFIQCDSCLEKYSGCCSNECLNYISLSEEGKQDEKKSFLEYNSKRLGKNIKPKLYNIRSNIK